MLYIMPIECRDDYKLIQLYGRVPCGVSRSSHTSTFGLISSVASVQPGTLVTIPLRRIKFFSVLFGATLSLLVISRHQRTSPHVTNFPRSGGTVLITPGGRSITARDEARYWSRIIDE